MGRADTARVVRERSLSACAVLLPGGDAGRLSRIPATWWVHVDGPSAARQLVDRFLQLPGGGRHGESRDDPRLLRKLFCDDGFTGRVLPRHGEPGFSAARAAAWQAADLRPSRGPGRHQTHPFRRLAESCGAAFWFCACRLADAHW